MNTLLLKQTIAYVLWPSIFFVSLFFLPNLMTFVEVFDGPSSDSAWYFVLNDFRTSIAAALGFALSIGLYFFLRPADLKGARNILMFSVIWYGLPIFKGVLIWLNTSNILAPDQATTIWATATAYHESIRPLTYTFFAVVTVALLFAAYRWRTGKKVVTAQPT